MKKKLIIKIGTSTLTAGTNRISFAVIESLARQIVELKNSYEVVIVSSGAIATARQFVEINGYHKNVDSKQAMAAIGQTKLIELYDTIFRTFGLNIAQILLTYRDFENPVAIENTRNTINKLWQVDYIPIVNENDTVSFEEIVLGDNDKLSALVATITEADLLVLVSDIDGIFDHNPHLHPEARLITEVTDLDSITSCIEEKNSTLGTGGMSSKVYAAEICMQNGVEMWIVNGQRSRYIMRAMKGEIPYTRFHRTSNQ
ncbi:MAG: glutamate 5-kinase [Proteiniphilum sp.]|jgi:glutamate 5-kinase|nr:glutamate 5-kinase [Proteiniphilum sp.]MDD2937301.1 glutamate 5-kinase [Proteiniphilum sp.]MDD3075867.1 glutamate 5-kinase [Proteiniphilum sp.]MDD3779090.1 glutamate 5-kinase [Proteiniphilum sp.]MDD4452370.1 glutamate 5-kinase [Proteiniphilum sp.]